MSMWTMYDALTARYTFACPRREQAHVALSSFRLLERLPGAAFHDTARTISLRVSEPDPGKGTVAIAAAGTADLPVAEEAAVTAEALGLPVKRIRDVGVAGVHRVLAVQGDLLNAGVVVVVVVVGSGSVPR